jgi:hypothetical protein
MQLHLDEIATKVTPGAHAVLILDQAGWHGAKDLRAPKNISLLPLPPRETELNQQENIWQFMRANWLSNRIFKSSLLLRLEYAHRSTVENHVHRSPRLGSRRSLIVRVGIRCRCRRRHPQDTESDFQCGGYVKRHAPSHDDRHVIDILDVAHARMDPSGDC